MRNSNSIRYPAHDLEKEARPTTKAAFHLSALLAPVSGPLARQPESYAEESWYEAMTLQKEASHATESSQEDFAT